MEEFVRGNSKQNIFVWRGNRRSVCVFHAAVPRAFANMKNEQIFLKRRAAHQRDFVFADLRKLCLKVLPFLDFSMQDNFNRRRNTREPEFCEITNFHWR